VIEKGVRVNDAGNSSGVTRSARKDKTIERMGEMGKGIQGNCKDFMVIRKNSGRSG